MKNIVNVTNDSRNNTLLNVCSRRRLLSLSKPLWRTRAGDGEGAGVRGERDCESVRVRPSSVLRSP